MEPLHHEVVVACDVAHAFDVFTRGMGSWWDPALTHDPASFTGIDVDPQVGGAVALRHGAAVRVFGEVTAWEPGSHYAQTFELGMPAGRPTTLEVRFTPESDLCLVTFEHDGWDEANAAARTTYADWPVLLGRFAEVAVG